VTIVINSAKAMLSQEEEQKIRETVRRSLENLHGSAPPNADVVEDDADDGADAERSSDAERIIAEETESYYDRIGLVKHTSRSGRVSWMSATEVAALKTRRRRRRRSTSPRFNPRVALLWAVTILTSSGLLGGPQ